MHRTIEQQEGAAGRGETAPAQGGTRPAAYGAAAALTLAVPVCLAQVAGAAVAGADGAATGSFTSLWARLAPQLAYGLQSALVLMAFVLGLLIWQRRAQRHVGWLLVLMPGWVVTVGLAPLSSWRTGIAVVLAPWLLWCAVHYLMRRMRRRDRRMHRALLVQALLFPAALLLPVPAAWNTTTRKPAPNGCSA